MNVPPAVLLVLGVAACGAALALAGFAWAAATGQLDPSNAGAQTIFDDGDDVPRQGARR